MTVLATRPGGAQTAPPAPRPADDGAPRRRPRPRIAGVAVTNGVLVLGAVYTVFPVLWLVFASLKDAGGLYSTSVFDLDRWLIGENVSALLAEGDGLFARWMGNSLLYSLAGAVVGGIVSTAAGYAFDKLRFRGKEGLFGFVLVGVLVPNTATVLPLYMLFSQLGMVNTVWAIILPSLCNPFNVYLARAFSRAYVPDETLEAARMDGAGAVRTFFSVALPMLAPGFVTIALFQFFAVWSNYMLPLVMLSDPTLYPVSLGISHWQGLTAVDPRYAPLVITGSLLSLVPLVVAFVSLQRYWRAGMTEGSVK
ncbi:carbohydrate ABC transporter permease [Microbacterium gilvum]|uniref:Carbohydrate ABC transporter permease n=1 Tax=Microbacterium gilvum TaxID=1336204 RepID=A0ABP9AI94_9MICO